MLNKYVRFRSFLGVTAHWIKPDLKHNCARRSAALACRRLVGSHTADLILNEIQTILQSYEIMDKVTKIVTDGGSNFVCAFKDRSPTDAVGYEELSLETESEGLTVNSLRDILMKYAGSDYPVRTHQICASHRFNNVMSSDIESAKKKINQLNSNDNRDEHIILGHSFFDIYDTVIKQCHRLWNKQQRSTVSNQYKHLLILLFA